MGRPERAAAPPAPGARPAPPAPGARPAEAGTAVATADRFYAAFNARDLETWLGTLADDVRIDVDALRLQGHPAARAYVEGILRTYPGVLCHDRRTVAATDDTVVSEFQLANPRGQADDGRDGAAPWRLDGPICEILRVRDGRITSVRSYYLPSDRDRTDVAEVPSRAEAARLADEQAALRRIAAHVAHGVPESAVFGAVDQAIGVLAGADRSVLFRLEPDGTASVLATTGAVPVAPGTGHPVIGPLRELVDRSAPARWAPAELETVLPALAGVPGDRPVLVVPVRVGGRVWGFEVLATAGSDPFAAGTEARISQFTDFVGPALAHAQADDELRQVSREQSELRSVAAVAAGEADTDAVFAALTRSASSVLDGTPTSLVRFDDDGTGVVLGRNGTDAGPGPAPDLLGPLTREIQRTGRPARVGIEAVAGGAAAGPEWPAAAAVPIVVDGRRWGMLAATSTGVPLPAGTEQRLAKFVGIVVAAIAGAQARTQMRTMAEEQAALRRVAELAAREAPAAEVLRAVAHEAARLAGVQFSILMRYERDGSTEIVALSDPPPGFAVGMRASPEGTGSAYLVWRTGQPARVDDLGRATGRWPAVAHANGYTASAAVPIQIRSRLWGAVVVVGRDRPLPVGTEEHLLSFAELAGTAISSAEDRLELRTLAYEQGSLRRVAELVARGAALEQTFAAASREASTLFEGTAAALCRYTGDGDAVVVASTNSTAPIGLRIPVTPDTGTGIVQRTGRPYRVESFADTSLAGLAAELGIHGAVSVPVTVEGEVWGTLSTATAGPPIPADAERRLAPFADLVAAAIAAAQNRSELLASRARVLTTADETRRRVQRDVHDGAQQRLVYTIINLKLARDAAADRAAVSEFVEEALRSAERANRELRDVVRGILPAALTRGGLAPGIESLVADLALPVDIRVDVPRLPAGLETTAYFVVAEALTNVVKHAGAGRAAVEVALRDGRLVVDVRDDGAGGADARRGTGLTGLHDRVAANDGRLSIRSPLGQGTHVRASLPVPGPEAGG